MIYWICGENEKKSQANCQKKTQLSISFTCNSFCNHNRIYFYKFPSISQIYYCKLWNSNSANLFYFSGFTNFFAFNISFYPKISRCCYYVIIQRIYADEVNWSNPLAILCFNSWAFYHHRTFYPQKEVTSQTIAVSYIDISYINIWRKLIPLGQVYMYTWFIRLSSFVSDKIQTSY